MGMLHAAYGTFKITTINRHSVDLIFQFSGAGALASPLVATQFTQMDWWSFHYLVSLGIAVTNTIALIAVFGFKSQDGDILFSPTSWTAVVDWTYFRDRMPGADWPSSTRTRDKSTQ